MRHATESEVKSLLSTNVQLPDDPPIRRFEVEFGGWQSPETFTVWIIVADGTPERDLNWDRIEPIWDAIFEVIMESSDQDPWPIVKVRTETEFADQRERP